MSWMRIIFSNQELWREENVEFVEYIHIAIFESAIDGKFQYPHLNTILIVFLLHPSISAKPQASHKMVKYCEHPPQIQKDQRSDRCQATTDPIGCNWVQVVWAQIHFSPLITSEHAHDEPPVNLIELCAQSASLPGQVWKFQSDFHLYNPCIEFLYFCCTIDSLACWVIFGKEISFQKKLQDAICADKCSKGLDSHHNLTFTIDARN